MRYLTVMSVLLVLGIAGAARADGLIYQLPDDGAQARYDMEIDVTVGGQQITTRGSLSISSVGQATIDNEKCRWIEFKMILSDDNQEQNNFTKVLVPEKHLGKGKAAADNVIRAWVKEGDMPAFELKDLKDPRSLAAAVFLAGTPKNPAELDKIEIDNPRLGKITSPGVTGEKEIDGPAGTQVAINLENRLHEKAPFGIVTANWKFELKTNGQVAVGGTFKLTLVEVNTTALSELPDKN